MPKPTFPLPVPADALPVTAEVKQRRTFSAAEKARILKTAAKCEKRGELAALLRAEGIYSSHLHDWRTAFERDGMSGLANRPRGPKPTTDARDKEIAALKRALVAKDKEIDVQRRLIALQKKIADLVADLSPSATT